MALGFPAATLPSLLLLFAAAPATFSFTNYGPLPPPHIWEISYQYKSPDCYRKLAATINGQSPGPTIDARIGDLVEVEIKNGLFTENVAIHWHGIRQIGTPWSDGTEGVTQCPILPGEMHTYRFVVDRLGTYIYHAHYGMQISAGLYGMIRVHPRRRPILREPFSYDEEHSIILQDSWHTSTQDQAVGLASKPFVFVGEPQSIMINGRGKFKCSAADESSGICNPNNTECLPYILSIAPNKTYRLRIASVASLSALNIEIEGHNMTVVEADGHYVNPFIVENLNIYSGETYSVLIRTDQEPRNYWIAVNVISREPATPTAVAILNYSPNPSTTLPPTAPPAGPLWNDTLNRITQSLALHSHPKYNIPPPPTTDKEILLLNTQNTINGYIQWSINHASLALPHTPYLIAIKKNLTTAFDQHPAAESYDYKNYDIYATSSSSKAKRSNRIYRLPFNATVDVVLQNANTLKPNNSETHPWHLHGHDFWVLGYGTGKYRPGVDNKGFNLADPPMKNTVPLHTYGWTAIRFVADNPGVWVFHCHIESHFFLGMGVVFAEGVEKVGELPKDIMGCGQSKRLFP